MGRNLVYNLEIITLGEGLCKLVGQFLDRAIRVGRLFGVKGLRGDRGGVKAEGDLDEGGKLDWVIQIQAD